MTTQTLKQAMMHPRYGSITVAPVSLWVTHVV